MVGVRVVVGVVVGVRVVVGKPSTELKMSTGPDRPFCLIGLNI